MIAISLAFPLEIVEAHDTINHERVSQTLHDFHHEIKPLLLLARHRLAPSIGQGQHVSDVLPQRSLKGKVEGLRPGHDGLPLDGNTVVFDFEQASRRALHLESGEVTTRGYRLRLDVLAILAAIGVKAVACA